MLKQIINLKLYILSLLLDFIECKSSETNMAGERTLLRDETNYRHTLQAYLKYMQQLPPQRKWMSEKLGPRLA